MDLAKGFNQISEKQKVNGPSSIEIEESRLTKELESKHTVIFPYIF
jgi:hypothetical protein